MGFNFSIVGIVRQHYAREKAVARIRDAYNSWSAELDLSGLGLTQVPRQIRHLPFLKTLDLSHNLLTELPAELAQLGDLNRLNLADNHFSTFPEPVCQLSKLYWLNLSANQLEELPEAIGALTQLFFLNLDDNALTSLPDSLQGVNLLGLQISNNRFEVLPAIIGSLSKLTHLAMNGNQLKELPDFLGRLTQLWRLHARDNQIVNISPRLTELVRLTTNQKEDASERGLSLEGNAWELPSEIFRLEPEDMLEELLAYTKMLKVQS